MRVTLVLVEIRSRFPGFAGYYSEGLASIAAVLRMAGHEVSLVHLVRPISPRTFADRVAATKPELVGFSCMTNTFGYVKALAPAIKERHVNIPTIVGGVHAIIKPEECIEVGGIDAVCTGEGETVMPRLIRRLQARQSYSDLEGLWVREAHRVYRNRVAPLVEDLDSLPMPDRSIFNMNRLVSTREGVLYVSASRGCPYGCRFCCNKALRAAFPNRGKYVRAKSVARVCREIEQARMVFTGRLRGIYFQDEIFSWNTEWLSEFAREYPRRVSVPFNCNLRADGVTKELASKLRAAGCASVSIGVETGVESLRREVLGKAISDAEYDAAFRILDSEGIRINTFSMVGLPGETCEQAMATVRMNADRRIRRAMVSICYPFPGSELREACESQGILSAKVFDTYQEATPLDQKSISADQVAFIHDFFALLVLIVRHASRPFLAVTGLASLISRLGLTLRTLSLSKRMLQRTLVIPYLHGGRFIANRQAKNFDP